MPSREPLQQMKVAVAINGVFTAMMQLTSLCSVCSGRTVLCSSCDKRRVCLQNLFSDAIERASSGDEGGSGYQWYVYSYQAGYLLRRATFMLEKLGTIHPSSCLCKQLTTHSFSPTHSLPGNASRDAIGRASVGEEGCQWCGSGYQAEYLWRRTTLVLEKVYFSHFKLVPITASDKGLHMLLKPHVRRLPGQARSCSTRARWCTRGLGSVACSSFVQDLGGLQQHLNVAGRFAYGTQGMVIPI